MGLHGATPGEKALTSESIFEGKQLKYKLFPFGHHLFLREKSCFC